MLKHLDLFSGIGGFALAVKWVGGIETVAFSEIDDRLKGLGNSIVPQLAQFLIQTIKDIDNENI